MEKFSLYDLLGLIMPGLLFVFVGQIIFSTFSLCPDIFANHSLHYSAAISLCLSISVGAFLFAANFVLVGKCKWYNALTGMYKHVADIYQNMGFLHHIMNAQLNLKTLDWLNKEAYITKDEYKQLNPQEKVAIKALQDESYDRIYYELEYLKLNSQSKTAQSFYFFFRQSALAFIILLLTLSCLYLLSLLDIIKDDQANNNELILLGILIFFGIVFNILLAKWFRERTVLKLYWFYFTYLNQPKN